MFIQNNELSLPGKVRIYRICVGGEKGRLFKYC